MSRRISTLQALWARLRRGFTNSYRGVGYVYVLKPIHQISRVKVGFSRKDPEKRLNSILARCRIERTDHWDPQKTSYARIVEVVSHIILQTKKMTATCFCGKLHREWFSVSLNAVHGVVKAVRDWANNRLILEEGPKGLHFPTRESRESLIREASRLLRTL